MWVRTKKNQYSFFHTEALLTLHVIHLLLCSIKAITVGWLFQGMAVEVSAGWHPKPEEKISDSCGVCSTKAGRFFLDMTDSSSGKRLAILVWSLAWQINLSWLTDFTC